jgi:hypothetical protein
MDTPRRDNRTRDLRMGNSTVAGLLGTLICRRCRDKVPCERQRPCLFRKCAEHTVPGKMYSFNFRNFYVTDI